jgi:hypothetical protein
MLAESNIPRVGALLRHRPSGLPARLERIAGPHVKIFKVLFADGTTKLVHLSELDDDLTEQEMERFSHDLPIVTETSLRQIIRKRKRLG